MLAAGTRSQPSRADRGQPVQAEQLSFLQEEDSEVRPDGTGWECREGVSRRWRPHLPDHADHG